jgi:hypothetical protein
MLVGDVGVLKERVSDSLPPIEIFTVKPCSMYLSMKIWRSCIVCLL